MRGFVRIVVVLLILSVLGCGAEPYADPGEVRESLTRGAARVVAIQLVNPTGAEVVFSDPRISSGSSETFVVSRPLPAAVPPGGTATLLLTVRARRGVPSDGLLQIDWFGGRTGRIDVPLHLVERVDLDGDGYLAGDGPGDDCDDTDPDIHPGRADDGLCDGGDLDCDPSTGGDARDERDIDGDGYLACGGCSGAVRCGDCDDADASIHPGRQELCDPVDHDCDGRPGTEDRDGDSVPPCRGDCADDDPARYPGAPENCEDDLDCDGRVGDVDQDGDGFSPCSEVGDCDDEDPDRRPLVVDASVDPGGLGTVIAPLASVDEALGALWEGTCWIHLEEGDYVDPIVLIDRDGVHLRGGSVPGSRAVIHGLEVAGGAVVVDQLDFVGPGPAIRVGPGPGGIPAEFIARSIDVSSDGRGVDVLGSNARFVDSRMHDNPDTALEIAQGGVFTGRGNLWEGNVARASGGAIRAHDGARVDLDGETFRDNAAGERGGAIWVGSSAEGIDVVDSVFLGNEVTSGDEGGGAIRLNAVGGSLVEASVFVGNTAPAGGALETRGGVTVRNNRFIANHSAGGGGAIRAETRSGVTEIRNNTLVGNTTDLTENGSRGIIHLRAIDGTVEVSSNLIVDGAAEVGISTADSGDDGEGICVAYNTVVAVDPVFADIEAPFDDENDCSPELEVDNRAPTQDPPLPDPFLSYDPAAAWTTWDLRLAPDADERDSGDPEHPDRNGTANDRGYTGGPFAPRSEE